MSMFGLAMAISFGVLLYAVAALVWDQRHELADWIGAIDPRRRSVPKFVVAASLLAGTVLLVRAAAVVVGLGVALIPNMSG